jgi:ribulose-phosphate 3-epimerase
MSHLIAPSLLASDFANLQSECDMINKSDADWYHLDVMDGMFVPNISFGIPIIKYINKHTLKPLDVHLMIVQPERYIKDFKNVGANILTVHIEASTHLHRTLPSFRKLRITFVLFHFNLMQLFHDHHDVLDQVLFQFHRRRSQQQIL